MLLLHLLLLEVLLHHRTLQAARIRVHAAVQTADAAQTG